MKTLNLKPSRKLEGDIKHAIGEHFAEADGEWDDDHARALTALFLDLVLPLVQRELLERMIEVIEVLKLNTVHPGFGYAGGWDDALNGITETIRVAL